MNVEAVEAIRRIVAMGDADLGVYFDHHVETGGRFTLIRSDGQRRARRAMVASGFDIQTRDIWRGSAVSGAVGYSNTVVEYYRGTKLVVMYWPNGPYQPQGESILAETSTLTFSLVERRLEPARYVDQDYHGYQELGPL